MRVIIADDEPLSRRVVEQLLERHDDVQVVSQCADGEAVREAIAELQPDVLFLDIRMPVASGLDVARARDPRTGPLVVFVTAHDEFALPAFDVDAVDYLTKPLVEDRFDAALVRVRDRLAGRRMYLPHLAARVGNRDVIIPVDGVEYIEADDVYAVVNAEGRRYLVRSSLDTLERALDPSRFARVHRSFIVRLDRIREIRRQSEGGAELMTATGVRIPVSRRRRAAIERICRPLAT